MIPVTPADEPATFDARVRQRGLSAIAEMVGEKPTIKRGGARRKPVATRREDLKPGQFEPYWREMIPELLAAYGRICAYSALYIHRTTGAASVDHCAPKSKRWDLIYEWDNYRLACSKMNARKNDYSDVMDPFVIEEGLFALELVTMKAVPGPSAGARAPEVEDTIRRLGLDSGDYAADLADYYHDYLEAHIDLRRLERHAPFLARELRRQGKLLPGDK